MSCWCYRSFLNPTLKDKISKIYQYSCNDKTSEFTLVLIRKCINKKYSFNFQERGKQEERKERIKEGEKKGWRDRLKE